jgi:GcrA cell cycle regulator
MLSAGGERRPSGVLVAALSQPSGAVPADTAMAAGTAGGSEGSHWPRRTAELLEHWYGPERPTQVEVAGKMGLTPGSVAGYLHRLRKAEQLPPRPQGQRKAWQPLPAEAEATRVARIRATCAQKRGARQAAPAWTPPPRFGRVESCCWPIGEPGSRSFRYCGVPSLLGYPWCADCARRAYVPTLHAPLRPAAAR